MFNKKEYMKEYNKKNRDRLKKYQRQWCKNNPEKVKQCKKKWRGNNLEKIKQYSNNAKEYKYQWRVDNLEKIKEYQKQYYKNNQETALKRSKQWRESHPEKMKEYKKKWYENNCDKAKERSRQWYENNHEKTIERNKQYCKKKYKTDPKFNLNSKIKAMIRLSLNENKAGRKWEDLVGYTLEDLYKRLKKTIPAGYTWEDYLNGKLHIDHIIPKNIFNYTKSEHPDFKRCWDLENLRLLPARENILKGKKIGKEFQSALKV